MQGLGLLMSMEMLSDIRGRGLSKDRDDFSLAYYAPHDGVGSWGCSHWSGVVTLPVYTPRLCHTTCVHPAAMADLMSSALAGMWCSVLCVVRHRFPSISVQDECLRMSFAYGHLTHSCYSSVCTLCRNCHCTVVCRCVFLLCSPCQG